jgi:photosystem II stability/assembly factor-like uncharacterized protein
MPSESKKPVQLIVGTVKGGFVARSDAERRTWSLAGPFFKGWKVTAVGRLPSGRFLVATASDVYGPALHETADFASFRQIEDGPAWPKGGERRMNQIWTLVPGGGARVWAGVDEAGLFLSEDEGRSWRGVEGLNEHPTRAGWAPGAGGLCAHHVLVDPVAPEHVWCGISAVGVFESEDGGASWRTRNEGVTIALEDREHPGIGYCVHALQHDPARPERIWRQDHRGMYRTSDGGESWERIEEGLPSGFGFPLARDRRTGALFALPLESDEYRVPPGGRLGVYRSTDDGSSWHDASDGLPRANVWAGVLRHALVADSLDPCGLYLGTTAGTLHVSADGGERWTTLPCTLPRILTLAAHEA